MSRNHLSLDQINSIISYLSLPQSSSKYIIETPIPFLTEHISNLPPSLLSYFTFLTPKQLNQIPVIKHRRLLYATSTPKPTILSAAEGRLRWPLLWENLGGDPQFFLSDNIKGGGNEEEQWVLNGFMSTDSGGSDQKVKKLGGFLRVLEEERESELIRTAKRMERGLDNQGEEFDDDSDDEDDLPNESLQRNGGTQRVEVKEDQEEVERVFEKRLLEIFLDGRDTIDYTEIDFNEPPGGDPIAVRDAEDRYFDDEEPSRTPNGHEQGQREDEPIIPKMESRLNENGCEKSSQNGQGEYDY